MKVVVVQKNKKKRLNRFLEWFLYMIGYTIVLITMSVLFESLYIDNSYYGLWALLAAIILFILNKTIKPIIVWLTLPITGLTLGLFYPFINVLILYLVGFILGEHFVVTGLLVPFFIAILISFMNILMENLIIDPILRRVR